MENFGRSSSIDVNLEECALCGVKAAQRSTQTQQFAFREGAQEVLLVAEIPVFSCAACGETYTAPGAEEAQHEAVCRHLKRLTPGEIRNLRERRGMSQAKLAEITGIGIASIKRWESGAVIQNASLDAQLRSLDDKKERKEASHFTPRFRTQLSLEALEAAKLFKLRRSTKLYAEAA